MDAISGIFRLVADPKLFGPGFSRGSVRFDPMTWTDDLAERMDIALPSRLAKAATRRKAEFVAGRFCARHAMHNLRIEKQCQIPSSATGAPIWPEEVTGSITHTRGFASAVVASRLSTRGIGLDSELIMDPAKADFLETEICGGNSLYPPLSAAERALRTTLIFSAKESLFKCLHPLVEKMFWLSDAHVELENLKEGAFSATLLIDLGRDFRKGLELTGYFTVDWPYVHTGIQFL